MRRSLTILLAATLTLAAAAQSRRSGTSPNGEDHPPLPNSESEKRILRVIDEAVQAGELYANVPAADGRLLRILTESVNARTVVEIGTSTGISGMWFCLALEKTGGRLHSFDIDEGRSRLARAHFEKAGVLALVDMVLGDAHQTLSRIKGPVDVVFIDAEKGGYVDYLNKVLPLVRPGGLILAHNVDMVRDYMRAVYANPALDTVVYTSGGGLAVTLKKR